jgi:D-methionine transport system substrate-binding protein
MFSAIFFLMSDLKANIIKTLIVLALAFIVAGATGLKAETQPGYPIIRVGFVGEPERVILERVKAISTRRGQDVELVGFQSSQDSLKALAARQIDLSVGQHRLTLEDFVQNNNINLISLGNTYISPLTFYSQKVKSLADIKFGDRIVISEEPDKRRRALTLLRQNGLINLNDQEPWPTKKDITDNPNRLEFIEAPIARPFLNNASVAAIAFSSMSEAINSQTAGWPKLRAICQEEPNAPYVYVLASRPSGRNKQYYLEFVKDFQSLEIAKFLLKRFEGTIIPVYDF